jgi:hypothetical protein
MLRIDKTKKTFIALEPKTMRGAGYWERRDIQEMICRTPDAFCQELGEDIHFVGSEIKPTDFVQDRIDLLGIDRGGAAVIIEIKRDSHKLHLLQALAYAGMVAKWEPKQFIEALRDFNKAFQNSNNQTIEQARDELEDVLDEADVDAINRDQRIVLLAEAFDYEVLVTAEWLTERYDLDIRCYRIALAKHGQEDLLTCTRAYPPPELTDIAIRRRRKKVIGGEEPSDWEGAFGEIENQAVVKFFREELAEGRPDNPRARYIRILIGGRRRFVAYAKRRWARIWQSARFDDDIKFWKARLGGDREIILTGGGRGLRFKLFEEADFTAFKKAITTELSNTEFHGAPDEEADEVDEAEGEAAA